VATKIMLESDATMMNEMMETSLKRSENQNLTSVATGAVFAPLSVFFGCGFLGAAGRGDFAFAAALDFLFAPAGAGAAGRGALL